MASGTRSRQANGRSYYLCQFTGWGSYAVLMFLMSAGRRRPGDATILLLWCACGMLGTHLLWAYSQRHPWKTIAQLMRMFAVALLLIPSAMIALQIVLNNRYGRRAWPVLPHYVQALII